MRAIALSTAITTALGMGVLAAQPAVAGTEWGDPQAITKKFGRSIELSDNGRVATWIRTNKLDRNGPVRTAYYLKKKQKWSKATVLEGTVDTADVQLSRDGDFLLITTPGTGLQMAQRESKNTWGAAEQIAAGNVTQAKMSGDANTVVWADFRPDPFEPYTGDTFLMSMTRGEDGAWGMPVELGQLPEQARYPGFADYLGISSDGSTLIWMNSAAALVASLKDDTGAWTAPVLLRQLPDTYGPYGLELSAAGTRMAAYYPPYQADGVVTATRTDDVWSALSYVTVDGVWRMGMSRKGTTISYVDEDGDTLLRRWTGTKWRKAQVLDTKGTSSPRRDLVQRNRTVAWSRVTGRALKASILVDGDWTKAKRLAKYSSSVGVSGDGRTVVWASPNTKRIYSVKR